MGRSVSTPTGAAWVLHGHLADDDEMTWADLIGEIRANLKARFRSLEDCDEWLDREDHAILENGHVYIGLSEYCGCVALWCVPKEHPDWWRDGNPLAERWAVSIVQKAEDAWRDLPMIQPLVLLGRFSNGEAVYRRA